MPLVIYNSQTRRKEEFATLEARGGGHVCLRGHGLR